MRSVFGNNITRNLKFSPKLFVCMAAAFALQLTSAASQAQLPEMELPSATTGQATTAKFFGGSSADGGSSYGSTFGPDQMLDVKFEIQVEASHIDTVGNLYLLAGVFQC